jgi:uncharacterized protein (TIGR00730 family)
MAEDPPKDNNTIQLSDEDAVRKIIIDSVFDLWQVVYNLTRLRKTTRSHYRVSIFGSARATPGSSAYEQVVMLARGLSDMGCDVVTGGGPGLMQAANEGATETIAQDKKRSVGIRVNLPFEQSVNPFVTESYLHETFFSRLHHFALASDAFIIVPGGIGTTLEATMVWQLIQVGHIAKDTPLIFVGKMWSDFLAWGRHHFLSNELVRPEDLEIPHCVNTAEEAISLLKKYHDKFKHES